MIQSKSTRLHAPPKLEQWYLQVQWLLKQTQERSSAWMSHQQLTVNSLDFSEISLSLPAVLPWDTEHGALCALYDSIDLPFE